MRGDIVRYLGHKPVPITPKRLATSQYSGEWASPYTGKGMDFRGHRAFELGDDPRTVHMAMSVRSRKRMVVERIAMRDISIFVLIDGSASMGVRKKSELLMTTASMLLISGMMLEMRLGAALISDEGHHSFGLGMGQRHASRLLDQLEHASQLISRGQRQPVQFFKQGIYRILPAGCMLCYLSDFLDADGTPNSGLPVKFNTSRYDYVPIVIQDEFDYSFPDSDDASLLELQNPETGSNYPVWIGKNERERLRSLHRERFSILKDKFTGKGMGYVHIAQPGFDQIHNSLTRFFLYR